MVQYLTFYCSSFAQCLYVSKKKKEKREKKLLQALLVTLQNGTSNYPEEAYINRL